MNDANATAPTPDQAAEPQAPAPRYDFAAAEPKWQAAWAGRGCFRADDVPADSRPKY